MGYQVLYRTYRPNKFSEVVGQEYIVKTLKNAIKNKKIAHAYLFAGPRGTGKTTIAKLFAKAINCEDFKEEACDECESCKSFISGKHPDIIELDAASNNGVDNIREIVDQVNYAPILGKYKIYIIDEVHMLSDSAFNALLKTLEEPPAHVIFILATTDPEKIIPTVLSRCQRYNFAKISKYNIKKKIIEILEKEKLQYEENAIEEIALMAEGGMRDALSLLEQMLSYNDAGLFLEDVSKVFGILSIEEKINLLIELHNSNIAKAIKHLNDIYASGADLKKLVNDLLEIVKETLIYSDNGEAELLNKIAPIDAQKLLNLTSINSLLNDIDCLKDVLINSRNSNNFLSYLELAFIKMSSFNKPQSNQTIIKEIKEIEKEPIKEIVKEEIKEEKIIEENINDEDQIRFIASLLLSANKDEKINDAIIYNRLELYKNDVDNRKYYELLNKTELFASCKDAIIVVGSDIIANNINLKDNKEGLYNFLINEYNINKVIYALDKNKTKEVISIYKELVKEKNNQAPKIEKPVIKKEKTNEEKLKELLGDDLKVV